MSIASSRWKQQRRTLQSQLDEANRKANETARSIGKAPPDEREALKEEGRRIRDEAAQIQQKPRPVMAESDAIVRAIPNLSHPAAPVGVDDKANLEIFRGKTPLPQFDFKPLDHVELAEKLDLIDFEGGARVAGHGFYFLKNDVVLLELALQRYALDVLLKEGFTPMTTPDLARNEVLQGIGFIPRGPETQIYSIEGSDLSLVATAEITLGGLFSGQTIDAEDLPLKLCGMSHCFRTEAGAAGRARAGCIASTSSPRSKCSPTRFPAKATTCSNTCGTWNAGSSTAWACRTGWSIRRPATWAGRPIASSTSRPGCPAAEISARSPARRTAPTTSRGG